MDALHLKVHYVPAVGDVDSDAIGFSMHALIWAVYSNKAFIDSYPNDRSLVRTLSI